MTKQYWVDAMTKNCVWLFQTMNKEYPHGCQCGIYDDEGNLLADKTKEDEENCDCFVRVWNTERVFLTREEARLKSVGDTE